VILKCQLKDVNDSVLTVTICVVKDNGSLSNDDEETEVSLYHRCPLRRDKQRLKCTGKLRKPRDFFAKSRGPR